MSAPNCDSEKLICPYSTWADAEIARLRIAIEQIRQATLTGKVCDDVAWFSDIETLHDFCASTLDPNYYTQTGTE